MPEWSSFGVPRTAQVPLFHVFRQIVWCGLTLTGQRTVFGA